MSKHYSKKRTRTTKHSAITATIMIFALAVSGILALAYSCGIRLQALLSGDNNSGDFFNFGS